MDRHFGAYFEAKPSRYFGGSNVSSLQRKEELEKYVGSWHGGPEGQLSFAEQVSMVEGARSDIQLETIRLQVAAGILLGSL